MLFRSSTKWITSTTWLVGRTNWLSFSSSWQRWCHLRPSRGLGLRRWPAPARHTRLRTTDGLRRALARLGQHGQLPWSPSGRSRGSRIPGTRSRSWPSGAAQLRRAAAAWSKRYDQPLRHGAEGADGLGSLGYQTGTSEPPPDEHGPATCPEWLITKQARREAAMWLQVHRLHRRRAQRSFHRAGHRTQPS